MKRRTLLAGGAAIAALGAGSLGWMRRSSAAMSLDGRERLAMPPLLDTRDSGAFELTALYGESRFTSGAPSATAGYNQAFLGPTVLMRSSGGVKASVSNALDEAVSAHWHGLMLPGEVDGGPHQPVLPGKRWTPELQIQQAPATAWYHTHVHGRTAPMVHAGLAGVIHVSDGDDEARGLPSAYGVDDLTLVLQDRRFDDAGRMVYDISMMDVMHGFAGDTVLVNGQGNAVAAVPKGIVRLRLVNGSNARIYTLAFDDGRPMHQIATDGGYLAKPQTLEVLPLAPSERAEVLVDFSDGATVAMISGPDPNQGPGGMMGRMQGMMRQFVPSVLPILPFAVDERLEARVTALPGELGAGPAEPNMTGAETRTFSLDMGMGMMGGGGFAINGRPYAMDRIDLELKRGVTERWVVSSAMLVHPFHVHGAQFHVLSENGGSPKAHNRGLKDTVLIDGQAEIAVRFDNPAGPDTPFMYHCHILEHEDAGMMGQFTVS